MTEDEARKKWCPMVRFNSVGGPFTTTSSNRGRFDNKTTECIVSDCMMWRWNQDAVNDGRYEGYCGLGGKP